VDGASPEFILRLIQDGRLPNFRRMLEEGTFAPHCFSSLPTSTPENWTTIATGAWNGTHQVMSFQVFQPPELHGGWMSGYSSKESEAEFIWDAVERAGKQSILLKYPASHPPTMSTGVQVCGCHVRPCAHQIDGAHLFSTEEPRNAPLKLRELGGTVALPKSSKPVLMGEMVFEARGLGGHSFEGMDEGTALYGVPDREKPKPENIGINTPVCKLLPPGKIFYVFVYAGNGEEYNRVVIAKDPSASDKIAQLGLGEWSPWLAEEFDTVDGLREGTLRFKLERLSGDGELVSIYATQIMDIEHFAFPEPIGRELYENVGPFITDIGWEGLGHDWRSAWFDTSVMLELADYQHQWMANAVNYLTKTRDWALCMLQVHCIDCAHHHCLGVADPAANSDREIGDKYLEFIEQLYESVDRMLGQIMNQADENTAIFVISDHGGLPGHIRINVHDVLEEARLLVRNAEGEVIWDQTRAYVQNGIFVNVNLQGREPEGIVPPEEFDRTCDEIKAALHAYVEPTTSLHPFNLVLRKGDMRYVGLYGDPSGQKVGDILFTLREPFGGVHGEQLSTARWGLCSNSSVLIMRGPGIRRGATLDRTVWLTDIVPTICEFIDVAVPRDTQGAVLYQAFEHS